MTPQQHADRLLIEWQANRHLPPAFRLATPHTRPANSDDADAAYAARHAAVGRAMETTP